MAAPQQRSTFVRQLTAAVARTDERGRWVHRVEQTGAYEAIVENGSDVLRLPFTVLNEPSQTTLPWIIIVPCLLSAGGVVILLVLGIRSEPNGMRYVGPSRGLMVLMAVLLAGSAAPHGLVGMA